MAGSQRVELDHRPERDSVAVRVGGDQFTEYRYGGDLTKPVLFPIRAPSGQTVTRGYPLDPQPGDRVDHTHHVGCWLNYGDVDGHDLWNFDGSQPLSETDDGGIVRHDEVERIAGGDVGELEMRGTWVLPDGPALAESTTYAFGAEDGRRFVDRTTTLHAIDDAVELHDDKEGLFAVRVATGLEHPSDGPTTRLNADGDVVELETVPGDDPSGEYYSSAAAWGEAVWGTRAAWVRLTGEVGGETVSVTMMDHPDNIGHPTHWHARGYGLFAANPLAPSIFSRGEEAPLQFELGPDETIEFRYRLAVDSGTPSGSELRDRFERFASTPAV